MTWLWFPAIALAAAGGVVTGTRWDLLPDIARYYARPALVALVALAGLAVWAYRSTKDVR